MIMTGWCGELLDIKGAFLHGDFNKGKNLFMGVPKGFEKFYDPRKYVLYLLKAVYGLKHAAMAFNVFQVDEIQKKQSGSLFVLSMDKELIGNMDLMD
jgi:hypothetical protein